MINYRSGEKVPAFAPLLSLLPKSPTFINGYLNETYKSSVKIGERVQVVSSSGAEAIGRVVSVGSRVVPIPERLLRIPTLLAWGREVHVQIPQDNQLISGEKVSVTKHLPINLFRRALATDKTGSFRSTLFKRNLEMSENIKSLKPEFSGLIYLKEMRRFLAISDDYPEQVPFLYMITEEGVVEDQVLDIPHIGTVKDLESISQDRGRIYLMSSLSESKKGRRQDRQWLIELERKGLNLELKNKVEIGDLILHAISNGDPDFPINQVEVEAHSVNDGNLIFIFKQAVGAKNSFRVGKIKNIDRLFAGQNVDVVWEANINIPFDADLLVTDMFRLENSFLIATSCKKKDCSAIWKISTHHAEQIYVSEDRHLEGITLTSQAILYGVHDSKKNPYIFNILLEPGEQ